MSFSRTSSNTAFKRRHLFLDCHFQRLRLNTIALHGCFQSNGNPSPFPLWWPVLSSKKSTPFNKSGIAEIFKLGSSFDIALMVEVIVDGCMNRGEFL